MAITVRVKINGNTVSDFKIVNQGHPDDNTHPIDNDLREYHYEYPDPEDPAKSLSGTVEHRRSNGWSPLVQAVLEDARIGKGYEG